MGHDEHWRAERWLVAPGPHAALERPSPDYEGARPLGWFTTHGDVRGVRAHPLVKALAVIAQWIRDGDIRPGGESIERNRLVCYHLPHISARLRAWACGKWFSPRLEPSAPLREEGEMRHRNQRHEEGRDQREREALHQRRVRPCGKSGPEVQRAEENGVHEVGDPKEIPGEERLAEAKPIVRRDARDDPGRRG